MKSHKKEDKEYLKALCEVLQVSENRLHLDECGDWNIVGRKGIISTDSEDWYIYLSTTRRKWNNIKKRFSWMDVTQDGDEEGIMKSNLCMSDKQAAEVRKLAGLRQKPVLTEEYRAQLREQILSQLKQGFPAQGLI